MQSKHRLVVFLGAMLVGLSAHAQALHFKVTGEYKARTIIAYQEEGGQATVKYKLV